MIKISCTLTYGREQSNSPQFMRVVYLITGSTPGRAGVGGVFD
jgi:hypothetical protein